MSIMLKNTNAHDSWRRNGYSCCREPRPGSQSKGPWTFSMPYRVQIPHARRIPWASQSPKNKAFSLAVQKPLDLRGQAAYVRTVNATGFIPCKVTIESHMPRTHLSSKFKRANKVWPSKAQHTRDLTLPQNHCSSDTRGSHTRELFHGKSCSIKNSAGC